MIVLVSSFRFIWIYLCYGPTTIINILIILEWGPSLDVWIWRLYTSDYDV